MIKIRIEKRKKIWTKTLGWSDLFRCLKSLHSSKFYSLFKKEKKIQMSGKGNSFNWLCAFSESTNRGGLHTSTSWSWLCGLEWKIIYLPRHTSHQLKSTQTYRKTRISHMDQWEISNHSSAVKDNDNIHLSISDQSYISTRVFYKKQICAKLEEGSSVLNGTCFDLWFPKLRNIQFLKEKFFLIGKFFRSKNLIWYLHILNTWNSEIRWSLN